MDDRPYMGMWYRLVGEGFRRWHFTIMAGPDGRPVDRGEFHGSQVDAAALVKKRIEYMERLERRL